MKKPKSRIKSKEMKWQNQIEYVMMWCWATEQCYAQWCYVISNEMRWNQMNEPTIDWIPNLLVCKHSCIDFCIN